MTVSGDWPRALIHWYQCNKRDLPWRRTKDPYAIWISEIMLQQTRVEAVISYYQRFLQSFPTVQDLAHAPETQVLKAWEGLGYYSRARNIHKAAKTITDTLNGQLPSSFDQLHLLSGIGDYTAAAIASIAFGEPVPVIDGNVKRVSSRLFGIRENINRPTIIKSLRSKLQDAIPSDEASSFNQAMMELGALICIPGTPRCDDCPLRQFCDAYATGDQDTLPVIDRKQPPKVIQMAVCLITFQNQILLFCRQERLLHGLFVFGLLENETDIDAITEHWSRLGLSVQYQDFKGEARHVFTHRVWEMSLLHFSLSEKPTMKFLEKHHAVLANREILETLPLPTAMKAAKKAAFEIVLFDDYAPR